MEPTTISYTIPYDAMFGRIPAFAHKPINERLTDKERQLFLLLICQKPTKLSICQQKGFEITEGFITSQTVIRPNEIDDLLFSLQRKGFICQADCIIIEYENIRQMARGTYAPPICSSPSIEDEELPF